MHIYKGLKVWATALAVALAIAASNSSGLAEAQGVTVIDATRGVTPEVLAQYHAAVLGNPGGVSSRAHIILLVSPRIGFDPGVLALPSNKRFVNVDVTVRLLRGINVKDAIKVNALALSDKRTLTVLRQRTRKW